MGAKSISSLRLPQGPSQTNPHNTATLPRRHARSIYHRRTRRALLSCKQIARAWEAARAGCHGSRSADQSATCLVFSPNRADGSVNIFVIGRSVLLSVSAGHQRLVWVSPVVISHLPALPFMCLQSSQTGRESLWEGGRG